MPAAAAASELAAGSPGAGLPDPGDDPGAAPAAPAGAGVVVAAGDPLSGDWAGAIERRHATKPSTRIATSSTPPIQRIMFGSFRSFRSFRSGVIGRRSFVIARA